MAKQITLTATKTYATCANAVKAVDKFGYPDTLRYLIMQTEDGRFFPVFVNAELATQHGVHFNFHVVN